MRRKGTTTTLQERLEIAEKSTAGHADPEIATMMGLALPTVRKWRRLFQREGRPGLASRMERPTTGALGSQPRELRQALYDLRTAHPGWGPDTLLDNLKHDPVWCDFALPGRTQVAAFLKEQGLTRRYNKHTELPQPDRERPLEAHQEWQMDAQGYVKVEGVGKVSTINIIDIRSRLKVESCPRRKRKPGKNDFMLALRRAFLQFGLPERISLDHDAAFFQNTSTSPFPMPIHLWLVALGVEVVFIRPRQPTDHAIIERHHQTIENQALKGTICSSTERLWQKIDERRRVLNYRLPTRVLNGQSPLEAFPNAVWSGRSYRPEWEADLLSMQRVHRYLAEGRWFRRISTNGIINIGGHRYFVGNQYAGTEAEITFDPKSVAFICRPQGFENSITVEAKGLTKSDLMGDLAKLLELPVYQLALPFSVEDRQLLDLAMLVGDTTFPDFA